MIIGKFEHFIYLLRNRFVELGSGILQPQNDGYQIQNSNSIPMRLF